MANFKYRGLSPSGEVVNGVVEAPDKFEAVAKIKSTCLIVEEIKEVEGVDAKGVACNENYVAFINNDDTTQYFSMYGADILTNSIESVAVETENTVIYDLTGRRVENIANAGIYIVNGKKVVVK